MTFTLSDIAKSACGGRNKHLQGATGKKYARKHRPQQSEEDLQQQCVYLFRVKYPKLIKRFFSVPNGGKRNAFEAYRLKLTGTLPGVWDLFLSVPKGSYCGLFIEMKAIGGKLTQPQIEFREANKEDYKFEVCNSFETFEKVIKEYLNH